MQSVVPSKGVASAAGLMNGLSNGVSALAPVAIGGLIAFTGTYAGGLSYLIGCSVVGCIMAILLYLRKI